MPEELRHNGWCRSHQSSEPDYRFRHSHFLKPFTTGHAGLRGLRFHVWFMLLPYDPCGAVRLALIWEYLWRYLGRQYARSA